MQSEPLDLDPVAPSRVSRSVRHDGSTLVWSHVRQVDERGRLIFEFATDFVLDGRRIIDRSGERFLDHTGHRVDGSPIIR